MLTSGLRSTQITRIISFYSQRAFSPFKRAFSGGFYAEESERPSSCILDDICDFSGDGIFWGLQKRVRHYIRHERHVLFHARKLTLSTNALFIGFVCSSPPPFLLLCDTFDVWSDTLKIDLYRRADIMNVHCYARDERSPLHRSH